MVLCGDVANNVYMTGCHNRQRFMMTGGGTCNVTAHHFPPPYFRCFVPINKFNKRQRQRRFKGAKFSKNCFVFCIDDCSWLDGLRTQTHTHEGRLHLNSTHLSGQKVNFKICLQTWIPAACHYSLFRSLLGALVHARHFVVSIVSFVCALKRSN